MIAVRRGVHDHRVTASPDDDGGIGLHHRLVRTRQGHGQHGSSQRRRCPANSAEIWWNTWAPTDDTGMTNATSHHHAAKKRPRTNCTHADIMVRSPNHGRRQRHPTPWSTRHGYLDSEDMLSYMASSCGRGRPAHEGMGMSTPSWSLMAETTYYYRVSAPLTLSGQGEYSDGMAMATTMVTVVDAPPLGPASGLTATANAAWFRHADVDHRRQAPPSTLWRARTVPLTRLAVKVWKFSSAMGDAHRVGGPTDVRYGVRLLRHLWPIRGTSRWQLAGQVVSLEQLVQLRRRPTAN